MELKSEKKIHTRLTGLFEKKESRVLNIYFTAGFPCLNDTNAILKALDSSEADMIEIGLPYSDPIADGPTIQESNQQALENGMKLSILFQQLEALRNITDKPVILMGYINNVIQYGTERFFKKASEIGIDGFIFPDLPAETFVEEVEPYCYKYNIDFIFLITPQTETERIKLIDSLSTGFVYMVSSAGTTGGTNSFGAQHQQYFEKVKSLNLDNPVLAGFGISNAESFNYVSNYCNGAIVGSAFIRLLHEKGVDPEAIFTFCKGLKGNN